MSANNLLLLLDITAGAINTIARVNQMMVKVQAEGRDVTDEELKEIMDENDASLKKFKDNIG